MSAGSWESNIETVEMRDWFELEVTEEELPLAVTFFTAPGTDGTDHDSKLFLCDWDMFSMGACTYGFFGDNLDYDDDGGEGAWSSMTYTFTEAGTYVVGVEFFENAVPANYTLNTEVVVLDGNDTPDTATEVTVPYMETMAIDPDGEDDWYTFTLDAAATLDFSVSNTMLDTAIVVCDQAQVDDMSCGLFDANLYSADAGFDAEAEAISAADFEAGTYYVLVFAFGGVGDYDVAIAPTP